MQAFVIMGIVALIVIGVIAFRRWKPEQYIIGEVDFIDSYTAKLINFDKNDGAYTGDPDKLYIKFLPNGCEFYDVDGNSCEALDITIGSKVKMTSTTGLKTDEYGRTIIEIKKVEVLTAGLTADEFFASNQ